MPRSYDDPDLTADEPPRTPITGESLRAARWALGYLRPYRLRVAVALAAQLASTALGLVFPFATGRLIDAALGRSDGGVNAVALALLGVLAAQAVCSFTSSINLLTAVERAVADMRRDTYARLIGLPMRFYAARRVGELTGRIAGDLSRIEDTLGETLPHFFRQAMLLVGGVVLIAATSTRLAAVMLLTVPPLVLIAVVFGRKLRQIAKDAQDRLADTNVIVEETLQGVATVKAFANEPFEIGRYRAGMDRVVAVALRGAWWHASFVAFIIFALFGGIVLVLWRGARMVEAGALSPGELAGFMLYTAYVAGALGSFAEVFGQLQQSLGATERVREILCEEPEPAGPPTGARLRGDVHFDEVVFRYPSRPDAEVLRGLTLEARAGQRVALVGPSGAGKSTAVALLLRFYDPDGGRIVLDGRDARTLALTELRAQVAIVPQDVILFGGSVAENIAYGRVTASQAEVEEAARKAYAHEFITAFPDGYQTRVGERGVQLSGGQRQRIAIARALLRDPAVLILDEATSSLDAESERLVQLAFDTLMQGRTALIIAHRLATVRRVDRIFVMDAGRIVEQGTHDELTAQPGGLYQSLARLQFDTSY
jgi:ATP-binding cassette subfamily B protein